MPRFELAPHLAALAGDPPRWPERTNAVSLLALDVDAPQKLLPDRHIRLELLDYPGEWLLDLTLMGQSFQTWSAATLKRLEGEAQARAFLAFVHGLPAGAAADEALVRTGHGLYCAVLRHQRDALHQSHLLPGRFLMAAPGPAPPWAEFFPMTGAGPLAVLLRQRYDEYVRAVTRDLAAPSFGRIDRMVVLADVLSALHAGQAAFADAASALGEVARALRWRRAPAFVPAWLAGLLPGISRVAFVASKADHVAERQRGNLAALMGSLTLAEGTVRSAAFAVAGVRCTEDFVWTLDGRPVSAVRGRVEGMGMVGSYPGEVPDRPPEGDFWQHPFLAIPDFQPMRLPLGGRGGVAHINLDKLLDFLLEDLW
jgi:predicted YcjX-like family ATPase